jgi:hypothetical protein
MLSVLITRSSSLRPSPESVSRDCSLIAEIRHERLVEFAREWFLHRGSWLTRVHHACSIATTVAIIATVVVQGLSWSVTTQLALAFVALLFPILPLHEGLHDLAYRAIGARDLRWAISWRMFAAYVMAHRFVATARPFVVVALAPFAVINALLAGGAMLWTRYAVFFLTLLLLHLAGTSGDWAMLNFLWHHRGRDVVTFDDAEAGVTYFYGR